MIGLDWRRATWWEYTAGLWHWNDSQEQKPGEDRGEPDFDKLRKFMAVH